MKLDIKKREQNWISNILVPIIITGTVVILVSSPFILPNIIDNYNIKARNVEKQISELYTPVPGNRAEAARYLGEFGEISKRALPDLFKRLDDDYYYARYAAAKAIRRIGLDEETIMLAKDALHHKENEIRSLIILAIKEYGDKSAVLIGDLIELLFDEDEYTRDFAEEALLSIATKDRITEELLYIVEYGKEENGIKAIDYILKYNKDNHNVLEVLKGIGEESGNSIIKRKIRGIVEKSNREEEGITRHK